MVTLQSHGDQAVPFIMHRLGFPTAPQLLVVSADARQLSVRLRLSPVPVASASERTRPSALVPAAACVFRIRNTLRPIVQTRPLAATKSTLYVVTSRLSLVRPLARSSPGFHVRASHAQRHRA